MSDYILQNYPENTSEENENPPVSGSGLISSGLIISGLIDSGLIPSGLIPSGLIPSNDEGGTSGGGGGSTSGGGGGTSSGGGGGTSSGGGGTSGGGGGTSSGGGGGTSGSGGGTSSGGGGGTSGSGGGTSSGGGGGTSGSGGGNNTASLNSEQIAKLIQTAEKYLRLYEKDPEGSAQVVQWLEATGYPNPTSNVAWCAAFVYGVFQEAGLSGYKSAGVKYWKKNWGTTVTTPQVGDVAFYNNQSHMGIVTQVNGDKVTIISGNWNDRVGLDSNKPSSNYTFKRGM